MSKQKDIQVKPEMIHLQSVKLIRGSIESGEDIQNEQIDSFSTDFEVQHGIDMNNHLIRFILGVKFIGLTKGGALLNVSAEYNTEFIFRLDNFLDYMVNKNEETKVVTLQPSIVATLMGIVYSTTRGIILTRTQGTIVDGIILPVVDPLKLLTGELNGNLKESQKR
ncbi:MAG: hypothetical protein K0R51_2204 [Cytophagaceae bacterium]|jgi:hypothetical protein|nr:hypothetical protein [Cytophagaceae bacterium]